MDGSGYVAGKAKKRNATKKPGATPAAAKPSHSTTARILTERKAIDIMAVTIRRNSKKLAASADRLLRRVS